MDSLPESAWANEFQNAPTRPLLSSLQRRLQASTTHAHALAEIFRERAVIEQEYATKLGRLAKAADSGQLSGKGAVDWDRHSGEEKLWDTVLNDIQETASSHLALSTSLKSDFEQPIRDLPNKINAWRLIHEQESTLDRTLKEAQKTAAKLDKASTKSKSSKADQLSSDLNQLNTTLNTLTPRVYTMFQRLDEERLRSLKEVVVRWATSRADVATKDGQRAEASLTKLLSWETKDDVTSVGHRLASASGGGRAGQSTMPAPSLNSTPRRASVQTASTADFTPRPANRPNGSNNSLTPSQGGGGGFSGLKSMLARKATVSSRQRSGSEATSMRSPRRAPTDDVFAPLEEGDDEGPSSHTPRPAPPRQMSDLRSEAPPPRTQASLIDDEGFSIAPADRHRTPWEEPNEDIPLSAIAASKQSGTAGTVPSAVTANRQSSAGVALPSAIFADQRTASPERSRPSSAAGSVDASGPTRLNLAMAPAPIKESEEERQAALSRMQQTLQTVPGAPTRRTTIARGRREARNTMQAENGAMQAHMSNLAKIGGVPEAEEQLADQKRSGTGDSLGPPPRRLSTASQASSRNPFESPSLHSPSSPMAGGMPSAGSLAAAGGIATGAGALAATAAKEPIKPDQALGSQLSTSPVSVMSSPGLSATVVETVHALVRQFSSQRTVVTGEIHLSYAPAASRPSPSAGSNLHIRLTEFDALESIAPNPAFLAQVPDHPGEYYLNVDVLAQASQQAGGGAGPVLFKYHVLVPEEAHTEMLPLALNLAYQVKEGETRMILQYRSSTSAVVSNLNLAIAFPDEPAVTATQSKPISGSWLAPADGTSGRQITWEPTALEPGSEGKVIARFITSPGAPPLSPNNVNARFVLPNKLVSGIGIEIVDGQDSNALAGWSFDKVQRSTVSGKYVGEASFNP